MLFCDFLLSFRKLILAQGKIITAIDIIDRNVSHTLLEQGSGNKPFENGNDVKLLWYHDKKFASK